MDYWWGIIHLPLIWMENTDLLSIQWTILKTDSDFYNGSKRTKTPSSSDSCHLSSSTPSRLLALFFFFSNIKSVHKLSTYIPKSTNPMVRFRIPLTLTKFNTTFSVFHILNQDKHYSFWRHPCSLWHRSFLSHNWINRVYYNTGIYHYIHTDLCRQGLLVYVFMWSS